MGLPDGFDKGFPTARPTPPSPPAPPLPGDVVVRPTLEDLLDEIAEDVVTQAGNCVRAFGDFHLAMSGGRAAQRLAMRLMIDPRYRELPWKFTHLWITSDLDVPEEDDRSTIGAVRGLLGDHAGVPERQVHAMDPHLPDAVERYEREIKEVFAWREKGHDRLDCVVLGVDDSGGFDGIAPAAVSDSGLVIRGEGNGPGGVPGLSMTTGFVRASRLICVMGVGEHGADVRAMSRTKTPAAVEPIAGVLRWYLDHPACGATPNGQGG